MKPDPRPEASEESHADDEYATFEDFTRKLIAVPKADIDKARKPKIA